ncbi:MAG: transporter substrate-binding protein [Herbaspirillum sp.]|nr:transporter substrate-binding protein [Herbaspirillum sp.]
MNSTPFLRILIATLLQTGIACSASAASFADLATHDSPDRHQALVTAAQIEGSINFYTSIPEKDMAILRADFLQRYGVRVITWRASTGHIMQRMTAEKQAGHGNFDVVDISSPELEAMYRDNLLQEVNSRLQKDLMQDAMPAHHGWAPQFLTAWVQAYNTNAIKKENLPKSYADLLAPKWKGMLGVEMNDSDWYCEQVKYLGQQKGAKLFHDIAARNKWSVRSGHSLLANLVVSGEVPLGLTTYSYMIDQAKAKGAPVDWFTLDPVIARSNGIGVSRNPRHPNAALLFYEYMISDAQPLMVKINYLSPLKKLESPLRNAKLRFVDPAASADTLQSCDAAFNALNKLSNN